MSMTCTSSIESDKSLGNNPNFKNGTGCLNRLKINKQIDLECQTAVSLTRSYDGLIRPYLWSLLNVIHLNQIIEIPYLSGSQIFRLKL